MTVRLLNGRRGFQWPAGHGYRALESNLQVLAEQVEWFDRHVKGS